MALSMSINAAAPAAEYQVPAQMNRLHNAHSRLEDRILTLRGRLEAAMIPSRPVSTKGVEQDGCGGADCCSLGDAIAAGALLASSLADTVEDILTRLQI